MKRRLVGLMALMALLMVGGAWAEDGGSQRVRYVEYSAQRPGTARPDAVIRAMPQGETTLVAGREACVAREEESIVYAFTCAQAGLYQLRLSYYPVEARGLNIEYALLIDGESPFTEARYNTLYRVWEDDAAPGSLRDAAGNDIIPGQHEAPAWVEALVEDHTGAYDAPYLFYLPVEWFA